MSNLERRDTSAKSHELIKRNSHDAATVYLLNQDRTHALLLFHRKLQAWLPPGGHTDGDLPQNAALREVEEETGIKDVSFLELESGVLRIGSLDQQQITLDDTLDSKIKRPFAIIQEKIPASSKEVEHTHIDYIYVGHTSMPDPNVRIDLRESAGQRWLPLTEKAIEEVETFPNVKAILLRLYALRSSSSL